MHTSTTFLTLLSFLCLSTSTPTPVDLTPRCGTTLFPTFLQQLTEAPPSTINTNTLSSNGDFHVAQTVSPTDQVSNRIYQVIAFTNLPSGSYGCQLGITFPANYPITSVGHPILNVYTLYAGASGNIKYPNDWSWNKFYPFGQPTVGCLFGTVRAVAGTTSGINSETCPAGGGNLAFIFKISSDVKQTASLEFNEYINKLNGQGFAGVYLTYDC